MKIVYLDSNIAVIDKEYGEDSQITAAPEYLRDTLDDELYTVHRLDQTTEGLMVYARNKKSAAILSEQIENGTLKKTYTAFVSGVPEPENGEMRDNLFFDRNRQKSFVSDKKRGGTKDAILTYEVRGTLTFKDNEISKVIIHLETGRTHQIRAQFSSRKHPLIGDGKYGSKINYKSASLCSTGLTFIHPITGEKMEFAREFNIK